MTSLEYRRAIKQDFKKMLELQNKNFISSIPPENLSNGFLSTQFTEEDFEETNKELCVAVCMKSQKLIAYLCATSFRFNEKFLILSKIPKELKNCLFQNKAVLSYSSFIASPACIDSNYRAQGILLELSITLLKNLSKNHEIAITLVAQENERSLKTVKKLGFTLLKTFILNNKTYVIFACNLNDFISHHAS
ncbi:MAG: hypothetical protein A3B69_02005 [Gammaproteobacteria bacterium RIFCSPHIGHO2_02_FULL_38_33]|nr:MAG: hypothetical protein A3B69_02005 [Gammaproteobacteria bacterium RIFCSPHIGHO2_02_FULL_38_33]